MLQHEHDCSNKKEKKKKYCQEKNYSSSDEFLGSYSEQNPPTKALR